MKRKISNPMGEERFYPDDGLASTILGKVLLQAGRYEEAISAFGRVIELNPEAEWVWANKGQALRQAGRYWQ